MITIRSLDEKNRPWANQFLLERWGSIKVVSRGQLHDPSTLPGFVAVVEERPVGLLTYTISGGSCEIVTLDSDLEGSGVGSALIEAARKVAVAADCWRLWLITTNDNLHALHFYQKRGFTLAAVHADAIRESRRLKPQIPLTGLDGIPIRDEIELEIRLGTAPVVIQGLNHVQITIPKGAEEEAHHFYGDILGLVEMEKPDSLKGRGGFWMHLGRQQLHVGTEDGVNRQATKAHLAYEVTNLELWRTRFAETGIKIEESVPIPGYERFEIRDPFGNRLEFIQPLLDSLRRFSNRVENYVRYRPDYPAAILPFLAEAISFSTETIVADLGSGTGKLSLLFVENGNLVYGIEPNDEMRMAAEALLSGYGNFISLKGTAEATTLAGSQVDLVTAGQAFHWFDHSAARVEFQRILKPGGYVVLVWNQWDSKLSPLLQDYNDLLAGFSLDAGRVRHTLPTVDAGMTAFFGPGGYAQQSFDHKQVFDFEGLKGRLLSSSYAPLPGHPHYEPMVARLQEIFDTYQKDGVVDFLYETHLYYGRLEDETGGRQG